MSAIPGFSDDDLDMDSVLTYALRILAFDMEVEERAENDKATRRRVASAP